eukprot:TRINITY_DN10419_c0_g1_i1.p1 TRINITY_DN10419_c0_g1~~TRINITY_DN10419_c0_g1_i1.p1  ORF type:complete len:581 (-),score=81.77 TRINITY_DN10419_c0_g1_i1:1794-3425(-)
MKVAQRYKAPSMIQKLILATMANISQRPCRGKIDQRSIEASSTLEAKMLEPNLLQRVFETSNGTQALSFQTVSAVKALRANMKSLGAHLQVAVTCQTLAHACENLLDVVETARYLALNSADQIVEKTQDKFDEEEEQDSMWNSDDSKFIKRSASNQNEIVAASLNVLIKLITPSNPAAYDNEFMLTLLTTYQSFAHSWQLYEKLLDRFNVPPDTSLSDEEIKRIRMRVLIVLKYWVEKVFFDLDDDLIKLIFEFVNNNVGNKDFSELAKRMKDELSKRIKDRIDTRNRIFKPPAKLTRSTKPIAELFLSANEMELAKQLTLIDFKSYSNINPTEFLSKSWNTPKLQHRAPNIIAMLSRANKMAFWVSSMILLHDKGKDRKKMVEKLILVAVNLKKLKNFHTLMGFIAGLNTSAILRLRSVKNASTKLLSTFKGLEDLMHPQGSFRAYRAHLREQSVPCLPYLGTYLTDLTFIEDGNPDKVDGLVNFSKRKMVYKIISEVQQYQPPNSKYEFKPDPALSYFLSELPILQDKDLYNLSLLREPKK